MSGLYIRVFLDFFNHRKTVRLRKAIGNDALWLPVRLWAYAAEHQPDGDFSRYEPEELAAVLGYEGDASSMLQALLKAGFLDSKPLRIHAWQEHNSYHQVFSERAKKAAAARWAKERLPAPSPKDSRKGSKHASSIGANLGTADRIGLEHQQALLEKEVEHWKEETYYEWDRTPENMAARKEAEQRLAEAKVRLLA